MIPYRFQAGYTILEVMIVLAVSAATFILAVTTFGGRQQEVQFTQAVRDFDSRLLDTANDISTGFFNNNGTLDCELNLPVTDLTAAPRSGGGGGIGQGQNDDCIFIGKAIQFQPSGIENDQIKLFNILGRRKDTNNRSVNTVNQANPRIIDAASVGPTRLDWGLQVTRITDGTNNFGAIGLFTTFSSGVGINAVSNDQTVRYVGLGTGLGMNNTQVENSVASVSEATINAATPITICLRKADNSKRAAIVLNGTKTEVQFDDPNVVATC